jgi:hypothetical protein
MQFKLAHHESIIPEAKSPGFAGRHFCRVEYGKFVRC